MKFRKESIQELRGDMPYRQFALMCSTTGASVHNWEQGYVRPGIDNILKLAKAFDKDLNFFVTNVHHDE
jgi:transcriptional regulator with XRE-family HTH domain